MINVQNQNINPEIIKQENKPEYSAIQNNNQNDLKGTAVVNGVEPAANAEGNNISFKEQLIQLANQNNKIAVDLNTDFSDIFKFETVDLDEDDAKFFIELAQYVKQPEAIKENITQIGNVKIPIVMAPTEQTVAPAKQAQASEKIMHLLETASKTNRPVRIDFDNNITLILKVDAEGRINAQFYPNDKIAEEYLKNNISSLRDKFDEEKILYTQLDYRQKKDNNNDKERRKEE